MPLITNAGFDQGENCIHVYVREQQTKKYKQLII